MRAAAVAGVVLAGGAGRRIGGAKGERRLGGRPLLAHVVARVRPQVALLLLNGDGLDAEGLPVVADALPGRQGPLAGLLGAMDWLAAQAPEASALLTVPVDTPFLPADLVARLAAALGETGAGCAVAASGGRHHPVVALWRWERREDLRSALTVEGVRKVDLWAQRCGRVEVPWPAGPAADPFFNINTGEELAEAERRLAAEGR
jgi:molybdopterin-guanine dinucleotide biosynthesis protein A